MNTSRLVKQRKGTEIVCLPEWCSNPNIQEEDGTLFHRTTRGETCAAATGELYLDGIKPDLSWMETVPGGKPDGEGGI